MMRAPLSYWTAGLQTVIAVLFVNYYFAIIVIILMGWGHVPQDMLELAKALILSLTGALGLLFAFLYLRSRVDGPPDPATTTTVQRTETTTTPSAPTGDTHATSTTPGPSAPSGAVFPATPVGLPDAGH